MKPQLPEPFALDQHPVVVPVGKEVSAQLVFVEIQESGTISPAEQVMRHVDHLANVNTDVWGESQVRASRFHQVESGASQAPQAGTKARTRFLVGGFVPQDPRYVGSQERPVAQGKERKQSLRACRELDHSVVANELEAAQQIESNLALIRCFAHVVGLSQSVLALHDAMGASSK
jgi:hypothetical protein